MIELRGDRLEVQVLEPSLDRGRLGSRYCAGGYIHQVRDARHGPLLAGPQWPAESPDVFHGQGAPEAFNHFPWAQAVPAGGEVGVLGVGLVRRAGDEPFTPRTSREVSAWAAWEVEAAAHAVTMKAEHAFGGVACRLTKTVRVEGRTVRSETLLTNKGAAALPVRWFAHPFFPVPPGPRLFRANIAFEVPDSPGFAKDGDGWICRKGDHGWTSGCFCPLRFDAAGAPSLELEQAHPLVGSIGVRTDFAPTSFPIWGNDRTFSVEPYWEHSTEPGGAAGWAIEYAFG